MKKVGDGIWAHEDSMRLPGMTLRLRMTVIELADGGLWVHSPTAHSPQLADEIHDLGAVQYIVGASNGHNLWLAQWQAAYPDATLYVSAAIPKKLKLSDYKILDDSTENIWASDLDHEYMAGVPLFNESVFLHRASQSFIVSDLIQNHSDDRASGLSGLAAKCIYEPIGFKDICVAPPLRMRFMIKDKEKFATSIQRIQDWDFNKIIVSHGDIIEKNAQQVFSNLCERFFT
ncbi:methanol oxidase [Gammaproteobacteria bacterium 53_120_T64]|nr:methanol oxidase [Gammaproteobacteria bacterium 53_120_T64]